MKLWLKQTLVTLTAVLISVGKNAYNDTDNRRGACREAVKSIGQVGTVGAGSNNQHNHKHIDSPLGVPAPGALERGEPFIVEFVALYERDGGLCALNNVLIDVCAGDNRSLCVHS